MDKPIDEWQQRLRGMDADQLNQVWRSKADDEVSWREEANFHMAAAERMKLLGFMAADLDEDTRKKLRIQAQVILDQLNQQFDGNTIRTDEFRTVAEASDKYFAAFGTPTARHYMYEQGLIDLLGDRLDVA